MSVASCAAGPPSTSSTRADGASVSAARASTISGEIVAANGDEYDRRLMDRERLAALLAAVQSGECPIDEALHRLRGMPFEDLGFANLDHHRALRNGFPEVVLGQGKTTEQVVAIAERLAAGDGPVLVTRLAPDAAAALVAAVPGFEYHATARLAARRGRAGEPSGRGTILVVSAGTADMPVAEEAAL